MKTKVIFLPFCAATGLLAFAVEGSASLRFFAIGDAPAEQQFQAAVEDFRLLGREAFSSSTLSGGGGVQLQGPILAPGQPNGAFPGGTDPAFGITLQVNTLGGAPFVPSAGNFLYASGPEPTGVVRVGPNNQNHSLDLFLDPPGFRGNVRAFRMTVYADGGTKGEIRVYSPDNTLLGFYSLDELGLPETKSIGILTSPGVGLFRINYWVPDGYGDVSNLEQYVIPEPAFAGFVAGFLAMLFLGWRKFRGHFRR